MTSLYWFKHFIQKNKKKNVCGIQRDNALSRPFAQWSKLTLKVLVTTIDPLGHFKQDNYSTVGGDGGRRVGEVRADTTSPDTTSPMPDHKGFKLQ